VLLRPRENVQLEAKLARDWMRDQNATLDAEARRRVAENDLTQQRQHPRAGAPG
jgi:putative two-component system response regulator